jgi:MoxR-like ATPase
VIDKARVVELRELMRKVPLARAIQDYAVRVLQATHPETKEATAQSKKYLRYGASPRGLQAIILAAKIRALLEGRYAVAIDDIRAVAAPALAPPPDPQLRGRGRGHPRRRHHRRDPQVDPRDGVS